MSFLNAPPSQLVDFGSFLVQIKTHPRARHLTLRYDQKKSRFLLTKPKRRFSARSIDDFLKTSRDWMEKQTTLIPKTKMIAPGDIISIQGRPRKIIHQNKIGAGATLHDDYILVECKPERFARTVLRFLKKHAEDIMAPLAYQKAAVINKPISRISFKDTTSRWGSCARGGKLSFSWRLIMAPQEIIDYLVGHEIAHLQHHHHGPTFWKLCRELTPHTDMGRDWLDRHGLSLHQIQFEINSPDSSPA
jgi:predicted metal-dependent hydrolase